MSDYPMLISNKLHSFRNFLEQKYKKERTEIYPTDPFSLCSSGLSPHGVQPSGPQNSACAPSDTYSDGLYRRAWRPVCRSPINSRAQRFARQPKITGETALSEACNRYGSDRLRTPFGLGTGSTDFCSSKQDIIYYLSID